MPHLLQVCAISIGQFVVILTWYKQQLAFSSYVKNEIANNVLLQCDIYAILNMLYTIKCA